MASSFARNLIIQLWFLESRKWIGFVVLNDKKNHNSKAENFD